MREADLMFSRRRFLLTSVKAAAGVTTGLIVGPEVFDMLDRMGPRRLMVPGAPTGLTYSAELDAALKQMYRGVFDALRFTPSPLLAQFHPAHWAGTTVGRGRSVFRP